MVIEEKLDKEWVCLLVQAKQMGIPIEEIRKFLQQKSLADVSDENKTWGVPPYGL